MPTIEIGLADDHPIFRRGLAAMIRGEDDLHLMWEAGNGEEALKEVNLNLPDVIILDVDMPVMNGFEAAEKLRDHFPCVKIVFLTMHKEHQIIDSMKTFHVKGYLLKDSAFDEVVGCVRKVAKGQTYLSPQLTEFLLSGNQSDEDSDTPFYLISNLTAAEKQILLLVSESKTSRQIADALFVSIRTVENHRFHICKKLNLKGNNALLRFALAKKNSIKSLLNK